MNRTILFIALFALCGGVAIASSPARAESGKGLFGFFNRSQSTESAPVHMTPGVEGTASESTAQTLNLGKKAKIAREEDSPVYAEQRRNEKIVAEWSAREAEITNARTAQVMSQVQAQMAYNEKVALQAQAQRIAQIQKNAAAGVATPPAQQTRQVYPQSLPAAAAVTTSVPEAEKPEETKPAKEPRKPRQFFNRIE